MQLTAKYNYYNIISIVTIFYLRLYINFRSVIFYLAIFLYDIGPGPSAESELRHDDVSKVLEELLPAQNLSYLLGLKLKLPQHVVDRIHIDTPHPRERLLQILVEFLKLEQPRPTWTALADALKSPVVNLPDLAERVEATLFPETSTRRTTRTSKNM